MKVVLSHPTGNQNVRAALDGLNKAEMLSQFYTSIASFENGFLDNIGSLRPLQEIHRRRFDPSLRHLTKSFPYKETGRLLFSKAGLKKLTQHETGPFSVDAVYHFIDRKTAEKVRKVHRKNISAVYAYEDGAEFTFRAARESGIQCLYDLPIGYWKTARKILAEEMEKWPDWSATLTGFMDSPAKLARKNAELQMADRIFVASHFTAQTLDDFDGRLAPVEVIPYGFPPVTHKRDYSSFNGRRLKILYVGSLSQRKGIANLFAAVEAFSSHVELTVIGRRVTDNCPALEAVLKKHRWIPSLSHSDILNMMQQHDVLVFPSLFEGFGLVITEAMSQGTPVITTAHTAGPEFISDEYNGWIIEAGSTIALKNSLEKILSDTSCIKSAGRAAMDTAAKRPWEIYGKELASAVYKSISNKSEQPVNT